MVLTKNDSLQSKQQMFNTEVRNCRKKLQDRFEEFSNSNVDSYKPNRSVLSSLSLNDTRRAIRNGTERLSQTLSAFRTRFGAFTQRFRISTKRRRILEEGPVTPGCSTPHTISRTVLGRTPTKLYSPFGIDSPYNRPLARKI